MAVAEHRFRAMASEVHLILVDAPPDAASEARAHLDRLEWIWSRFLPDSDITRANERAGHRVPACADTLTLVATMVEAWHATGGRYDPTLLPSLVAAGYAASRVDPTHVTRLPAGTRSGGDLDTVVIDPVASSIALPPGMALDPGGIGKGLAADLVVAGLLDAGAAGASLGIGGDLTMAGRSPDPAGWRVAVEGPDPDGPHLGVLAVTGGGVATSSTRSRRWEHGGRTHHHLIEPGTGLESDTDLTSVTVVAPTGWLAEAHATGALLSGSGDVLAYLAGHDLVGVAVTADGRVLATPELAHLARAPITQPAGGVR